MKVLTYMKTICSVSAGMSPNITRVHKQAIPVIVATRNTPSLTVSNAPLGNHATCDQNRYVNLDKFDGKVGDLDSVYHEFEFIATHYN